MTRLSVLIVDDEPGMRYGVKRALRGLTLRVPELDAEVSFDLEEADSGEAALDALAQRTCDIMLLDHKMGGMTGVEVLDQLRRRDGDILVVMITAFATIDTAVRATKSGAFDFLTKPFTPDELTDTIRKAASHLLVQRRARELADEKRRVRFDFIRVLGHELKSPLAAIESYLNVMKERVAGERLADYDDMIDRSLLRAAGMRKLIADLLDLTYIESGQKKRELTLVDAADAASAALEAAAPHARTRGVRVTLECRGPTTLHADRGEIDIVLNNLISNAVKYNREHGEAAVSLVGDERRLCITVRDTGIGLSAEEAARLFQDFARIRNAKTRDIPGSGLGLSIIKKIAALYHGDVTVESQPDVGSTFTVVLHRQPPAQEPSHDAQHPARLAAGA